MMKSWKMQNNSYRLCKAHLQQQTYIISQHNTSCKTSPWMLRHIWMHWRFQKEVQMSFCSKTHKMFYKCMQSWHLSLWTGNVDLQYVINEIATVKYVCTLMTNGEKGMGETLKRVAKECWNDAIQTQMKKLRKKPWASKYWEHQNQQCRCCQCGWWRKSGRLYQWLQAWKMNAWVYLNHSLNWHSYMMMMKMFLQQV